MGVVSDFMSAFNSTLTGAASDQFKDIATGIGNVAAIAATLFVVVLIVNSLMQFRQVPIGDVIGAIVRCLLIITIGLNWTEFFKVYDAIQKGMDSIAGVLLSGLGKGALDASKGGIAGAMDSFVSSFAEEANKATENLSWYSSGIMNICILLLLAAISAASGIIMIFAKVAATIHIAIAPLFIGLSIFPQTRDYFSKWVQSTYTYLLYPVVVAGVLGLTMRIISAFITKAGSGSTMATISEFIPMLTALVITLVMIVFIPNMVTALSGTISPMTVMNGIRAARGEIGAALSTAKATPSNVLAAQTKVQSGMKFMGSAAKNMVPNLKAGMAARQAARAQRLRK